MDVKLRPAGIQDATLLMEFIQAYYAFDKIPFHPEEIRPALEELLSDGSFGKAWFIQADGHDAGYVLVTFAYDLEFGGRVATITDFYVRPEYRRSGLGTQTVAFLENALRLHGVKTLELQVERANREAFLFYRRRGFHEHDRIPMSKSLTGSQ